MNMSTQPEKTGTHPLILAAAAAVIALSLAGIAAVFGWIPGNKAEEPAALESVAGEPAPLAPLPAADTASAAAEPAAKVATNTPAKSASKAPAKKSTSTASSANAANAVSSSPTSIAKTPPAPAKCMDCGVVEDIRSKLVEPDGSGLGGVAGGVVGGLLGNQVGKGGGRTAATVAGAVGGAFLGNKIEKTMKKKEVFEIVVRYEDGTTQTFPSDTPPAWRVGDKVRLENGVLVSR